ncbi:FAD-dependent oxidoreductase [Leptolyngbya ohadii]|uniref:FAD-dependent oxidoreductase n=1 Tax=Leptolyngbya ohadii TaxID=1962290 RepID=UPI000B59DF06|nr:NAD(P)/FAD-dependent oxidoreductase [Leptolyngbya ohadii]
MAVEYDLVILGGTALARSIAAQACRFQAQVALVEPHPPRETDHFRMLLNHWVNAIYRTEQIPRPPSVSISTPISEIIPESKSLARSVPSATELLSFAAQTAPLISEAVMAQQQQSLEQLAAAGVDVMVGQGEFQQSPRLGFQINGRSLRSRAYVLAVPSVPEVPLIPGMAEATILPLDDLAQFQGKTLPERIAILGDDPQAIELAQTLRRLGIRVTLIQARFLPQFDPAARLLQAQLEAEGVELFVGIEVERIEAIGGANDSGIRLYGKDGNGRAYRLEADLLLLATPRQPNLASLNLDEIGVRWTLDGVKVNRKLQTTCSRVYACGETLGGFTLPQLSRSEADLILHNALFLPPRSIQSRLVPWTLMTDPQIAQVGMDETSARKNYGDAVRVISASTQTIARAYVEEISGFCRLILRKDGRILGGTIVAPQASEWISVLTLAIQQRLKMADLARLPIPSATFAELLDRLSHAWQHQRFTPRQRTWLDRYFDFRRSWSS